MVPAAWPRGVPLPSGNPTSTPGGNPGSFEQLGSPPKHGPTRLRRGMRRDDDRGPDTHLGVAELRARRPREAARRRRLQTRHLAGSNPKLETRIFTAQLLVTPRPPRTMDRRRERSVLNLKPVTLYLKLFATPPSSPEPPYPASSAFPPVSGNGESETSPNDAGESSRGRAGGS